MSRPPCTYPYLLCNSHGSDFFLLPLSLSLTNISTLILIPLPLQSPLSPGCLFLVISSILPKASWISSINWGIKSLFLSSFSYSSEETNYKISKLVKVLRKGENKKQKNPPNPTEQHLTVPQDPEGSRVEFQIFMRPPGNFVPEYHTDCLLLGWASSSVRGPCFLAAPRASLLVHFPTQRDFFPSGHFSYINWKDLKFKKKKKKTKELLNPTSLEEPHILLEVKKVLKASENY